MRQIAIANTSPIYGTSQNPMIVIIEAPYQ